MKRLAMLAVLLAGAAVPLLGTAPRAAAADSGAPCVTVRSEALWSGLAYNHIVHLSNACAPTYTCTVSTDVNPTPQTVRVPGQTTVDVVTFLGSPARTFVARVSCAPETS